uniref:C2H2-type domain-containing protein n=2 Tax=Steinernema glaseri TaxID=37863 RepID=A0A1I7YV12_9BILA
MYRSSPSSSHMATQPSVSVTKDNMCRGTNAADAGSYFLSCLAELDDCPPRVDLSGFVSESDDEPVCEPSTSAVKGPEYYLQLAKKPNFIQQLMDDMAREEAELEETHKILDECKHNYEQEVQKCTDGSLAPLEDVSLTSRFNRVDTRCTVCGQAFASRNVMLRHVQRKHPENYADATKTRVFNRDPSLEFQCDQCGKGFAKKASLSTHRRRHFTERNHSCPYMDCKKKYLEASELRKHVKRVHKANL